MSSHTSTEYNAMRNAAAVLDSITEEKIKVGKKGCEGPSYRKFSKAIARHGREEQQTTLRDTS